MTKSQIKGTGSFETCIHLSFIYLPCVVHSDFFIIAAVHTIGKMDPSHFVGSQQIHCDPLTRFIWGYAAGIHTAINNSASLTLPLAPFGRLKSHSSQGHIV